MRHTGGMEPMEFSPEKKQEPQDNAPLFVSLYIVLLAFFIMLNTIATQDAKKIADARDSIAHAFSFKDIEDMPEVFSEAGVELSATQFFSEINAVAASFVPVEELQIYTSGNTMEVVMPQEMVFIQDSAKLQQINIPFFEKIATTLTRWQDGLRIEAEILISAPRQQTQLFGRGEEDRLPPSRAAAIGNYLDESGVAPKSIVPGLNYDDNGNVTLRFNVRDSERSLLKLGLPEAPNRKATP